MESNSGADTSVRSKSPEASGLGGRVFSNPVPANPAIVTFNVSSRTGTDGSRSGTPSIAGTDTVVAGVIPVVTGTNVDPAGGTAAGAVPVVSVSTKEATTAGSNTESSASPVDPSDSTGLTGRALDTGTTEGNF